MDEVKIAKEARKIAEKVFSVAAKSPCLTTKGVPYKKGPPKKRYLIYTEEGFLLTHRRPKEDYICSVSNFTSKGMDNHNWNILTENIAAFIGDQNG